MRPAVSARGLRGPLREVPHFVSDHREPRAGFARARGLDGGVEREDVRLEGDLVDRLDDSSHLAARRR
jgi:hypothetical protein